MDAAHGEWPTADRLEGALRDFSAQHALADDTVYSILPRHEITTRILALPSQDPTEVLNMIRLSAEEYVPYPPEELIIAQAILHRNSEGGATVLAALAHKEVVQRHLAHLAAAGLEPERLLLSTACLASAAAAAPPTQDRYALVNLAAGGVEILVFHGGRLEFGRAIAVQEDWTRAGQAQGVLGGPFDEVAQEVRSSLSAYRRESEEGEAVATLFVASDYAPVEEACAVLAAELGLRPQAAAFLRAVPQGGAEHLRVWCAAALGAALIAAGNAKVVVDLLPESVRQARRLRGVQRLLRLAAAGIAANAAMLCVLFGVMAYQRQSYIGELEGQLSAIATDAGGIAAKKQQLRIIRQQVERGGSVLEMLAAVTQAAPEGRVNVTRFSYSREAGVDLWGRARAVDDVHRFAENLRGLAAGQLLLFKNAMSQYEQKAQERAEDIYLYQISMSAETDTQADHGKAGENRGGSTAPAAE